MTFFQYCIDNQGILFEVFDAVTLTAAKAYLKTADPFESSRFWIGLTDAAVEDTFVWSSSNLVATFTDWDDTNVNNNGQDCVRTAILDAYLRRWIVDSCSNSYRAFCQTSKALFTRDIFAHNIAIKRNCNKFLFWSMDVNRPR